MSRPAKVAAPALALACLAAMLVAAPAGAASTDRQQPMSLDADNQDSLLTDDGRSLFRGNVRVQQGSLDIRADLGSVSYRGGEIAVIEFTGSPATLFQRQDDGTPLTVRANSITYDLQADRTELNDLAAQQPGRVREMAAQYEAWAQRCGVLPRDKVVALMRSQGVTRAFWEDE